MWHRPTMRRVTSTVTSPAVRSRTGGFLCRSCASPMPALRPHPTRGCRAAAFRILTRTAPASARTSPGWTSTVRTCPYATTATTRRDAPRWLGRWRGEFQSQDLRRSERGAVPKRKYLSGRRPGWPRCHPLASRAVDCEQADMLVRMLPAAARERLITDLAATGGSLINRSSCGSSAISRPRIQTAPRPLNQGPPVPLVFGRGRSCIARIVRMGRSACGRIPSPAQVVKR